MQSVSVPSGPYQPGAEAPATCEIPYFAPVRVRGGRHQLLRLLRHRRRAVAAGLAVTAAALVAAGPRNAPHARGTSDPPDTAGPARGGPSRGHPAPPAERAREQAGEDGSGTVTVPVRIADAAAVRLLRPGDRVDVIAAEDPAAGGQAHVVARGATVSRVPEAEKTPAGNGSDSGALVVLSVPRATAARLAGAGVTTRLAVTLC